VSFYIIHAHVRVRVCAYTYTYIYIYDLIRIYLRHVHTSLKVKSLKRYSAEVYIYADMSTHLHKTYD